MTTPVVHHLRLTAAVEHLKEAQELLLLWQGEEELDPEEYPDGVDHALADAICHVGEALTALGVETDE